MSDALSQAPLFWVLAIAGVLFAGISKAGFGGATGGLAVPLMSLVMAPPRAAAIMLLILLAMDALGIAVFRGRFDREQLKLIVPGAIVGITLGALTFGWVDPRWIRGLIGLEAVLFALDRLRRRHQPTAPRAPSRTRGALWSTVSGFTSFISHAGGPPIMQYLLPLGMDKVVLVGTTVVYFSVVNFVKLVPYASLGLLDFSNLLISSLLLPAVPVGYWIGLRLLHGLDSKAFHSVLAWLLLLTGCKLLWDAILG